MILALAMLFGIWADLPPEPATAPLPACRWAANKVEPWLRRGRRG